MELYKIVCRGSRLKKHFYESSTSFLRGEIYHVGYLNRVKDYLKHLTVECFKIDYNTIDGIHWRFIKTYQIIHGKVV